MNTPRSAARGLSSTWSVVGAIALALVLGWTLSSVLRTDASAEAEHSHNDHEGHDHGEHDHAHDDGTSIELTEQTRRNIGLKVGEVALQPYDRSIMIPSIVVERPGQTTIKVAAPVTGVVAGVYAVPGESVPAGQLLFTIRLTHEDVVQAQSDFLQTLGQLDVEEREIARLEQIESGAVAPRVILERKYAKDKLIAALNAQRESLQLHGLTMEQIATIERDRKLLREIKVLAPVLHADSSLHDEAESEHPHEGEDSPSRFVVTELVVRKGEVVAAGAPMATVADYSELFIEGRAFQQDAEHLVRAANANRNVTAVLETASGEMQMIPDLVFSHVANQVDAESRSLHFYVRLPNEVVRDEVSADGRHFPTWRFKVGQRMQVRVPIERWEDVIVLPIDAVAQEGPDRFVFVENGDHFDRRPVHVTFSDQLHAIIANDGSIFPGDSVALNSAHQLQMAIKNKAGGAVDPHAGHNH